ncbi:uncharacterized protein LOC116341690 [Contarinia nasturtii]|uniref:uncharacterized protein LOC116341690 n=1 Tax=Contarinia nasturtii TaxID=265458 RepID=UPI0012D49D79|nr:uncharacterized protein LOC116341690 [Contarinia nasturtii]
MIRTFLIQAKKSFDFPVRFCTNTPIVRKPDINEVRIVGTLTKEPFILKSGTYSLSIKTEESDSKYTIHNVHTRFEPSITPGERIHVTGKLFSIPVEMSDGKTVTEVVIKAYKTHTLDNSDSLEKLYDDKSFLDSLKSLVASDVCCSSDDINFVEILGNVASHVLFKDEYCSFVAATHRPSSNERGEVISKACFHQVYVYDECVRKYIEKNVTRRDRILLTGRLGHRTHEYPDGRRLYTGCIIPKNAFKIKRPIKSENKEVFEQY